MRRLEEVFLKQRVLSVFLPLVRRGTSDTGAYTVEEEEDVPLKQSGHNAMGSDGLHDPRGLLLGLLYVSRLISLRLAALRVCDHQY